MILNTRSSELLNELTIAGFNFDKIFSLPEKEIDRRVAAHEKRLAEVRATLRRAGVNVDKAERVAKAEAAQTLVHAKVLQEAGELLPNAADSFKELANDMNSTFLKTFMTMYSDLKDSEDVNVGILLFVFILAANTAAMSLAVPLLGMRAGAVFVGVVVAPIVEETARRQAITQGKGLATLTLAINVFEFTQYVTMMVSSGISLGVAIAVRGVLAVLHQFLGALQKWGYIKDIQNGVDPKHAGRVEYVLAIMLHAINNAYSQSFWNLVFPGVFGESVVDEELFIV